MFLLETVGKYHMHRVLSCLLVQTNGFSSSLYTILNVSPKATQKEIKDAFYRNSKLFHPDVNPTPEAKMKFQKISEAYQILGNPMQRRNYDRGLTITSRSLPDVDDSPFNSRAAEAFRDGHFKDRRVYPNQHQFEQFVRSNYTEILNRKFQQKKKFHQSGKNDAAGGQMKTDVLRPYIILTISVGAWLSIISYAYSSLH